MGYIKVLRIFKLIWNRSLYLNSKCVLCSFIHSFIHLLKIPESITGTKPMDMEFIITYIV